DRLAAGSQPAERECRTWQGFAIELGGSRRVDRTDDNQALGTGSVVVPPYSGKIAGFEPVVREVVDRGRLVKPELGQVDVRGAPPGSPDPLVHLPADSRLANGRGSVDPQDRASRLAWACAGRLDWGGSTGPGPDPLADQGDHAGHVKTRCVD